MNQDSHEPWFHPPHRWPPGVENYLRLQQQEARSRRGDLGTQAPHVRSRRALENSLEAIFFTSKFCGWRTKLRCSCVWKGVISCRVQAMNRPVPGHVDHQEKGQRKMADYVSQARPGTSKKWRCARYSISYHLMVRNHQLDYRLLQ